MINHLDQYISAYGAEFGYAFDNNILLHWYPRRIISLCPKGGSLLELGIGHGYSTQCFSEHFTRHVVIDGSDAVIQQFHTQYPQSNAEVVCDFFEEFETEERFDVIVMGFVLEHVADPTMLLRKFRSFLTPGGRCFVTVPNAESLHRRIGHAARLLGDMMALGDADRQLGHIRLYTAATLAYELKMANYRLVRQEGIFLKSLTTAQLISLNLDNSIIEAMCTVAIDYPELSCALLAEVEPLN